MHLAGKGAFQTTLIIKAPQNRRQFVISAVCPNFAKAREPPRFGDSLDVLQNRNVDEGLPQGLFQLEVHGPFAHDRSLPPGTHQQKRASVRFHSSNRAQIVKPEFGRQKPDASEFRLMGCGFNILVQRGFR